MASVCLSRAAPQEGHAHSRSGKMRLTSICMCERAFSTTSSVNWLIPCMKTSRRISPFSILLSWASQSPVMDGELSALISISSQSSIRRRPLPETLRSRPSRAMYFWRRRPSIVAARVAGVPRPRSDIASRNSSSSISLPAPSMAARSVDSV